MLPYVITEIGFNHEGSLKIAEKMIKEAAKAGANAVKFQTYRASDILLPSSPHFDVLTHSEFNLMQHKKLASIAKANKIDFLSTPYSCWAVGLLEKVGVKAYKIASMDITNIELLKCVAKTGKPIIISTGMANLHEIFSVCNMMHNLKSGPLTILHCLSEYPAKPERINLAFMNKIREICKCHIGYSDHTKGTTACLIASILGAQVIEKHFTLDSSKLGADHCHSAEPAELKQLIDTIKTSSSIIGKAGNIKRRTDRKYAKLYRRGIYAATNMNKGTKITKKHLTCCRPESEFLPGDIDKILGKTVRFNIKKNSPIRKRDI